MTINQACLFLSRSTRTEYRVVIKVKDGGGKSNTAEVLVNVINVEAPPTFSSPSYDVTVAEGRKVGDTVKDIKADYGDSNALLKYHIVSGNSDKTFCINYKGLITIARPLDREKVSNYVLKVMVGYGNSNSTTTVNVKITDVNDDTPHFPQSVYTFEVDEGPPGMYVSATFKASSLSDLT